MPLELSSSADAFDTNIHGPVADVVLESGSSRLHLSFASFPPSTTGFRHQQSRFILGDGLHDSTTIPLAYSFISHLHLDCAGIIWAYNMCCSLTDFHRLARLPSQLWLCCFITSSRSSAQRRLPLSGTCSPPSLASVRARRILHRNPKWLFD